MFEEFEKFERFERFEVAFRVLCSALLGIEVFINWNNSHGTQMPAKLIN